MVASSALLGVTRRQTALASGDRGRPSSIRPVIRTWREGDGLFPPLPLPSPPPPPPPQPASMSMQRSVQSPHSPRVLLTCCLPDMFSLPSSLLYRSDRRRRKEIT